MAFVFGSPRLGLRAHEPTFRLQYLRSANNPSSSSSVTLFDACKLIFDLAAAEILGNLESFPQSHRQMSLAVRKLGERNPPAFGARRAFESITVALVSLNIWPVDRIHNFRWIGAG